MQSISGVLRFLERYNTGGRSAEHLKTALLKRIQSPSTVTGRVLKELTPAAMDSLINYFETVDNCRIKVDEFLAFARFVDFPFADELYRFIMIIDWNVIKDHFNSRENNETF